MMSGAQQFCVRWNSYHTNLQTVFPKLLSTENFADVTLACESRQLRCHKVVLSACSAYFERLLVQNPCKHPIIFMKDMRFSEMQSLVDFMYKGEVNVTQDDLPSLLKSAEALQIRGLCSADASGAEQSDKATQATQDHGAHTDNAVASRGTEETNGASPSLKKRNGAGRGVGCGSLRTELKEERVEEDGLYYGDIDTHQMDYAEEESGKANSSVGQPSDGAHFIKSELDTMHMLEDDEIPEDILARPRLVGRKPRSIVDIETDVFQEKSYKQYSSMHLRQALIAVKKGYSVYAASNKYGVPRKTLRNWMEKYDIKSQYSKGRRGVRNMELLDPLGLVQATTSHLYNL